jgi:hypothetical protein
LPDKVLIMPVFRKIPAWLVLASYLFANTLASSWHDHRDCCGHSCEAPPHTTNCVTLDHHDHNHGCGHAHCLNHEQGRGHAQRQSSDGNEQRAPQHCVVCDFLALAPLPALPVGLTPAADVIPQLVALDVVDVASSPIETHLARGPPAL